MPEELGLDKPGWKFTFANNSALELVARLKQSVYKKDSSLSLFKTTTGRRRIYLFSPAGAKEKYLVKAYIPARISKRIKYLVRNSRCKQEFEAATKLETLDIPAVRAIAFGYRTSAPASAQEIVIEPYLQKLKNFNELWKGAAEDRRKELFIALGRQVALMHKNGVLQRDFKPDSLLVESVGADLKLVLADLERIKFKRGQLSAKSRDRESGERSSSLFSAPNIVRRWRLCSTNIQKHPGWNSREVSFGSKPC